MGTAIFLVFTNQFSAENSAGGLRFHEMWTEQSSFSFFSLLLKLSVSCFLKTFPLQNKWRQQNKAIVASEFWSRLNYKMIFDGA